MEFDLISDFHTEMNNGFSSWETDKKNNILIMAGDNGNEAETSVSVLKTAKMYYDTVIFVDGNHEFYDNTDKRRTISDSKKIIRDGVNKYGYIYLDKMSILIDRCLVIGANGWYNFDGVDHLSVEEERSMSRNLMNDNKLIDFGNTPPDQLALDDANFLKKFVEDAQDNNDIEEIVVVTHTVPISKCVVGPNHPWYRTNGSFLNTFMSRVSEVDRKRKIRVWCFGHTHTPYDTMDGHIRYICNPRGYIMERQGGHRGIISVDTLDTLPYRV